MTDRYDEVAVIRPGGVAGPPVQDCLAACRRELEELRALVASQAKTIEALEVEVEAWRNTQLVLETRARTEHVGAEDTKAREPDCKCHLEEGDSPCPVHEDEDDDDYEEIRG